MANLNRVHLIGRLTRNPELSYTSKGTPMASLWLAVNRSYKGDDGTRQEETTFLEAVLWARTAEVAAQYLTRGSEVYIEGRLAQENWTNKLSGQKRSKIKITAESMQMLSPRSGATVKDPESETEISIPF